LHFKQTARDLKGMTMTIDVVAAVIRREDTFLICQRPLTKKRGGMWEFPGGKVEAGETPAEALIRECREELDITVVPGRVLCENLFEYPDITIRLIAIQAELPDGEPRLLEHSDARWITANEAEGFVFCPADEPIVAALRENSGK
jgi:ADP-ribose pyrophosphatase